MQLPLSLLQEELKSVQAKQTFGDTFPLESAGLDDIPADAMVPGELLPMRHCCFLVARVWLISLKLKHPILVCTSGGAYLSSPGSIWCYLLPCDPRQRNHVFIQDIPGQSIAMFFLQAQKLGFP